MRGACAVGVLCTLLASVFGVAAQEEGGELVGRKICIVAGGGSNTTDDAPAILDAFKKCGQHGRIVFEPKTYHISSALNVTWLDDVEIDLQGTLLVRYTVMRAPQLLGAICMLRQAKQYQDFFSLPLDLMVIC